MEDTDEDAECSSLEFVHLPAKALGAPLTIRRLYASPVTDYWSLDWSTSYYRAQARAGFISTSLGPVLLPTLQASYAVLDWEKVHLSRSMRRWMERPVCQDQGYTLVLSAPLDPIVEGIRRSYDPCWVGEEYGELLARLRSEGPVGDFEFLTPALVTEGGEGKLVAGEIGYRIGRTYTSLSGFFDRGDPLYSRTGMLQLYLLAQWLREEGFSFWNLGQFDLELLKYKQDFGAVETPRKAFLERWWEAV
ncbi:MAG: hypothetical protein AAF191_02135 [Verrucomicrobiota bacterium]